jgi:hypothetical protein
MRPMPKFNPKIGDLVYFVWEDHCSYYGCAWEHLGDIGKRLTGSHCETAGFVIDITPGHITTVANITKNKDGVGEDGSQVATRLRKAIVSGKIIKRFK